VQTTAKHGAAAADGFQQAVSAAVRSALATASGVDASASTDEGVLDQLRRVHLKAALVIDNAIVKIRQVNHMKRAWKSEGG